MRKIFTLVLISSALFVNSQIKSGGSYKDYFQEGSYLLLEDNYILAQENFEAAYAIDSTSANVNYMLGICYLHSALQKPKAEYFLANAVKNVSRTYKTDDASEKASAPLAHLFYGEALHINYKFDEAIKQYDEFKKFVSAKDKEWTKLVVRHKETANYAKELVAIPMNVQITNLGDSVNSQYPDYSPVLSADERTLIFTTRRPNTTGGFKEVNGLYNEDVVVCYKDDNGKWTAPQSISPNINTSAMEAVINLSPDGQTLIIYKDGGEGMAGNIYYSTYDGKDWTTLKEFGSDVNSKYQESHACLSADGNVLFFVSDRPGGIGGKDIYRCIKLPNGIWSKALNMGPTINTEYDEDGAFIHPDGVTFFFSSNGHKSMGGYDIFFASLNSENKFSEVTNLGFPINTTDDDVFFVTSPDGKRSYLSSGKDGGYGEKDIYMVSIPGAKEKPLALFKGQIVPAEGEKLPEDIIIIVKDKQTGEIVGSYRPKLINGTFSTILPPGKEYNFSYQAPAGEEFYNEDVFVTGDLTYQEIAREVNLEPVKLLGKISAKKKSITLMPVVLDNPKSKTPVIGAKITLQEKGSDTQIIDANAQGKFDGVNLKPEKKYTIFAEVNGKKSAIADISTVGVKSGKVVNQILYVDGGKVITAAAKDVTLDLAVKNSKTKKPIANAAVTLTDADGGKIEATTNEKGIANVPLSAGTKYKLIAVSDASTSEEITFTTPAAKSKKSFNKTILINQSAVASNNTNNNTHTNTNATSDLPPSEYEFYFTYNQKKINDADAVWTNFIDKVVELSKQKTVTVRISSSASRVPCRNGNKRLASARAKKLQSLIKEALEAKGGNVAKIKFSKKSKVGGPKYRGDFNIGRKKYEKFQYVKAKAS
ncbi:MAG: PD40 domain-containing protein [Bacteroidetes bacterium]|nr:PD40 domain-containing protein [Bacteroidota bacterium]